MSNQPSRGVAAAGHPATTEAAAVVLDAGGNAFDAAIAAAFAACVAEPLMISLAGGGVLVARPSGTAEDIVYDGFVHTPNRRRSGAVDLSSIVGDFGGATQVFHIGLASIATPGLVKALFRLHRDHGRMPMMQLVEPAMSLARDGVLVTAGQESSRTALDPIVCASAEAKHIFVDRGGGIVAGARFQVPEMAGVFESLAGEGDDLLYRGALGHALADACRDGGGHLDRDDLAAYRVERRPPKRFHYRRHTVVTCGEPSLGGRLLRTALRDLERDDPAPLGSPAEAQQLARAMIAAERARARALGTPVRQRGTTHISVADRAGNVVSLTATNGEGCGWVIPGTGIMPNNMLGEEDLLGDGVEDWPENRRMATMMTPSLLEWPDGRVVALGSGGSSRIRTALLQVVARLLDGDLDLGAAVDHPRFHLENGRLDAEPGLSDDVLEALTPFASSVSRWDSPSLYFGGVHAVDCRPDGRFTGTGDPRRDGASRVV